MCKPSSDVSGELQELQSKVCQFCFTTSAQQLAALNNKFLPQFLKATLKKWMFKAWRGKFTWPHLQKMCIS